MTRRRWIADEVEGDRAALTGSHADHLTRVLRARVGDEFDIAFRDIVRRGTVSAIGDCRVEFFLGDLVPSPVLADVSLFIAIFKFDRMEWAIEKATELGVSRIVPLIAHRSERHLVQAARKRTERWRRLVLQASEQSRRAAPPRLEDPVKLNEAVRLGAPTNIVLSENQQSVFLKDVLANSSTTGTALAVGPEGGWIPDEETIFENAGWLSASLGHSILRAETAAIAALAIAFSELS